MAAELQRPTTGDGTRQAGGSSRSSQRARAARRSWLPPPGRRPLREGRFRQKRCVGIRGSQKKMGAGCDAHAISFLCFMIHFLKGIERRPYREAFFYGSRRGLYFGSGGRAWTCPIWRAASVGGPFGDSPGNAGPYAAWYRVRARIVLPSFGQHCFRPKKSPGPNHP